MLCYYVSRFIFSIFAFIHQISKYCPPSATWWCTMMWQQLNIKPWPHWLIGMKHECIITYPPNFVVLCGYFVHVRSNRNVSILKQGGPWELLSAELPKVAVDSVEHFLFWGRRCCTNTYVLVVGFECLNLLSTVILMSQYIAYSPFHLCHRIC